MLLSVVHALLAVNIEFFVQTCPRENEEYEEGFEIHGHLLKKIDFRKQKMSINF